MAVFETSLVLNVTREQAFDFLIRPANHERISPPELGLRFVNPPDELALGTKFEFKLQAWGMVRSATHEIIRFERPLIYVERQIQGSLKSWQHEHRFEVNSAGQVVITDRIEFAPPGGLTGMLVTESKLRENLEDGFHYRHQQLKKLLEGAA